MSTSNMEVDLSAQQRKSSARPAIRRLVIPLVLVLVACGLFAAIELHRLRTIGQAYQYALPLYEMARLRERTVQDRTNPNAVRVNTLQHNRTLADHRSRMVTTPNNDTLYSLATLDLSAGPLSLAVPDTGGRYYSVALIDAYTDNVAIIGSRLTGTSAGQFTIVGPGATDEAAPSDRLLRSPTPYAVLLIRTLVNGAQDLDAVHALQDGFVLKPSGTAAPAAPLADHPQATSESGDAFLRVVNAMLRENPPPAVDNPVLAKLAAVGLGPQIAEPNAWQLAEWKHFLPIIQRKFAEALKRPRAAISGWTYSPPGTGNFGTDYTLRAAIALNGLLALPPAEAIYSNAVSDADGAALDGTQSYRWHIPPGGLPVDAFWSLSAYSLEADGRLFFTDNPIHRYAIGDRTEGLQRNPDGSIDVLIQHEAPADTRNWLPIQAGPVRLSLRSYQPRPELLNGSFHYPPLEKTPL